MSAQTDTKLPNFFAASFQWPPQPMPDVQGNWVDLTKAWPPLAMYGAWIQWWNTLATQNYSTWVSPVIQAWMPWMGQSIEGTWASLADDIDSVLPTASVNAMATLMAIPLGNDLVAPDLIAPAAPACTTAANAVTVDDLTRVEGIGPKIAQLLINAGISSYKQLAQAGEAQLKAILKDGGSRYAVANPATWAEQAALLASGQIEAFETLTRELRGGIRQA